MSLNSFIRNWKWIAPIALAVWSSMIALTTWAYGVSKTIAPLEMRIEVVEKTQADRRTSVESIPVVIEKLTTVEGMVKEISRDTKSNGERLSRIEGAISKSVAATIK